MAALTDCLLLGQNRTCTWYDSSGTCGDEHGDAAPPTADGRPPCATVDCAISATAKATNAPQCILTGVAFPRAQQQQETIAYVAYNCNTSVVATTKIAGSVSAYYRYCNSNCWYALSVYLP